MGFIKLSVCRRSRPVPESGADKLTSGSHAGRTSRYVVDCVLSVCIYFILSLVYISSPIPNYLNFSTSGHVFYSVVP